MKGQKGDMVDSMFKISLVDGLPLTVAGIAGEGYSISHVYQYVLRGLPQKDVSNDMG